MWNQKKRNEIKLRENRLMVNRGEGEGAGKMNEGDQEVQTSSYK